MWVTLHAHADGRDVRVNLEAVVVIRWDGAKRCAVLELLGGRYQAVREPISEIPYLEERFVETAHWEYGTPLFLNLLLATELREHADSGTIIEFPGRYEHVREGLHEVAARA